VLYHLGFGFQQFIGFTAKLFGVGLIWHGSIMPQGEGLSDPIRLFLTVRFYGLRGFGGFFRSALSVASAARLSLSYSDMAAE
jgi:hypothetical protein